MAYRFEDKQSLLRKIEKLCDNLDENIRYIEQIRDIIIYYNKNMNITANTNGIFIDFSNLSLKTYAKLEKLLITIDNNKKDNLVLNKKEQTYDYVPYDTDETSDDNSRLRINNKEKNIIKRKHYEEELHSNSNVFLKKK